MIYSLSSKAPQYNTTRLRCAGSFKDVTGTGAQQESLKQPPEPERCRGENAGMGLISTLNRKKVLQMVTFQQIAFSSVRTMRQPVLTLPAVWQFPFSKSFPFSSSVKVYQMMNGHFSPRVSPGAGVGWPFDVTSDALPERVLSAGSISQPPLPPLPTRLGNYFAPSYPRYGHRHSRHTGRVAGLPSPRNRAEREEFVK